MSNPTFPGYSAETANSRPRNEGGDTQEMLVAYRVGLLDGAEDDALRALQLQENIPEVA